MILPRARGVIGDNGMEQEEQIRQHGSIFPREKTLKANITNMERKQRFSTLASSLLHKVNKVVISSSSVKEGVILVI